MNRLEIDLEIKEIALLLLPCLFLFSNGFYLFACVVVFYLLFFFVQQKNKPGVFTFMLMQHLLQIIAGVLYCIYLDKDINFRAPNTAMATLLSAVGLVFLFIPIIYFQNKIPSVSTKTLREYANYLSTQKVFNCYLTTFFLTSTLMALAFAIPGLTQIMVSFLKIKWFFFLLFGFLSILKDEHRRMFYLFIGIEFLTGFLSFFSDFKTVIYFMVVLLLSISHRLTVRQFFTIVLIGVVLAGFAVFWTGIKGEYRAFLNGGAQSQTVQVSREEAMNKLLELSSRSEDESSESRVAQVLDRLQYTHYFALTISRVPDILPHTYGNNWKDNLLFTTTPRFLNPDKAIFDPTAKTRKYTGRGFAGYRQGASFSLGYFAECYIDFGPYGMMFLLLLIGWMFGATYFFLMRRSSQNLLFNFAVACAFFMEFYAFEMDGTYLLGRFFSSFLTFLLLIWFFFPWLMKYISTEKVTKFAYSPVSH